MLPEPDNISSTVQSTESSYHDSTKDTCAPQTSSTAPASIEKAIVDSPLPQTFSTAPLSIEKPNLDAHPPQLSSAAPVSTEEAREGDNTFARHPDQIDNMQNATLPMNAMISSNGDTAINNTKMARMRVLLLQDSSVKRVLGTMVLLNLEKRKYQKSLRKLLNKRRIISCCNMQTLLVLKQ